MMRRLPNVAYLAVHGRRLDHNHEPVAGDQGLPPVTSTSRHHDLRDLVLQESQRQSPSLWRKYGRGMRLNALAKLRTTLELLGNDGNRHRHRFLASQSGS